MAKRKKHSPLQKVITQLVTKKVGGTTSEKPEKLEYKKIGESNITDAFVHNLMVKVFKTMGTEPEPAPEEKATKKK